MSLTDTEFDALVARMDAARVAHDSAALIRMFNVARAAEFAANDAGDFSGSDRADAQWIAARAARFLFEADTFWAAQDARLAAQRITAGR
jgi:hypothetical protein